MQKEVVIFTKDPAASWRMICDEGPYLNGTDLAPFPLGFFAAGQMFALLAELLAAAEEAGVSLDRLALTQTNRYTMTGSFLRGDATGGALPPEIIIRAGGPSSAGAVAELVRRTVDASPSLALMRAAPESGFSLRHNERAVLLCGLQAPPTDTPDPAVVFMDLRPVDAHAIPDIIVKTQAAPIAQGVAGGAGSSLQAIQNRTLHIAGEAAWLGAGQLQCDVGLVQPIGSSFRFRCDTTGREAPGPLEYLAAGIGFCFMTQLGRYAHIRKLRLTSYRLNQESAFGPALRIATHTWLESEESDEVAADILRTGERTCFLHAALRAVLWPAIQLEFNDTPVAF
ncbi:MAG: OsmC family protein [Limisphaerales bacterium]